MDRRLYLKREKQSHSKNRNIFGCFVFLAAVMFYGQAMAMEVDFLGKPLNLNGYVNQGVAFGVAGDHYDTMQGFQQAIMQALLEIEYRPDDSLKVFVSGLLFKDWAYNILDGDDDWEDKHFDESRNEMSLRTDYEDVLKECHITWTPGDFNLRVGKQIVSWGRMDGVRIMDQINPKDQRLGPSDVEFETSIIPIWLAKLEYYPQVKPRFLNDLGIEFIYNPNVDFIPDKAPSTGNYVYGIWSANSLIHPNPLLPAGAQVGALIEEFDTPDKWSDGHEYGIRLSGTFTDQTLLTLNYFDGVEDLPVYHPDSSKGTFGLNLDTGRFNDKGQPVVEPYVTGGYEDKRYAGFTLSREFSDLYIGWLGGVSPVLRVEALYEFDTVFTFNNELTRAAAFEEYDAVYWGMGVEWKFKWNLLNPRRYFSLVPQFSHRYIKDYPSEPGEYLQTAGGSTVSENNYVFSVRMDTWYLLDKLQPFIFYQRGIRSDVQHETNGSVKSDLWLFRLNYVPNSTWTFKTQLSLFSNDGYDSVDHYDNISFTVQYQF